MNNKFEPVCGGRVRFYDPQSSRLCDQLKLTIDYLFVFSVVRGMLVVAAILLAKLARRPHIHVPIPGTRRTVRLRTDSSDIGTYNQIFIRREYDFSRFPQAERVVSGRDGS